MPIILVLPIMGLDIGTISSSNPIRRRTPALLPIVTKPSLITLFIGAVCDAKISNIEQQGCCPALEMTVVCKACVSIITVRRKKINMEILKSFFRYRKMKSLLTEAMQILYSEQFSFDAIVNKLKGSRLQVLLAINFAACSEKPITQILVNQLVHHLQSIEQEFNDSKKMRHLLTALEESSEIQWLLKCNTILEAKLACAEDEYSYKGYIYKLESIKKQPLSEEEITECQKLLKELAKVEDNMTNRNPLKLLSLLLIN